MKRLNINTQVMSPGCRIIADGNLWSQPRVERTESRVELAPRRASYGESTNTSMGQAEYSSSESEESVTERS